jgi:sulfate/thiosulfate transport system ATP-binding protein
VLLLDEPVGALDAKVRQELRRWLRRLHQEIHLTSVFVTHDQEEALELANRVVVMNEGKIEQDAAPGEVIERPATSFVSHFLGNVNLFHGRVQVEVHDEEGQPRPMELDGERSEAVRVIVGDRVYVRPRAGQPTPQSPDRR